MITVSDLFWIAMLGLAYAYWSQAQDTKNIALDAARKQCRQLDVEFLDDSVVLRGLSLQKNLQGQWRLRRRYQFEFSSTGDERYQGEVVVLGNQVLRVALEPHRYDLSP